MKTEEKIIQQNRDSHKRLDLLQQLFLFLLICLSLLLATVLYTMPGNSSDITDAVARLQKESGVESPVTAVLLNFRGYDTLLEVMVLLLAVVGARSLIKSPYLRQKMDTNPVQLGVVRLLTPLMFLIAAYLVWQGSHLAGGAFQGGAVLGAAGVLILVAEPAGIPAPTALQLRFGLTFGPLLFLGVALICLLLTGSLLDYPEEATGWLILLIETACALSIGLTLAALFAGGHPESASPSHPLQDGKIRQRKQP